MHNWSEAKCKARMKSSQMSVAPRDSGICFNVYTIAFVEYVTDDAVPHYDRRVIRLSY